MTLEYRVPEYLHRPIQVLWFEQDELLSIVMGYVVGFMAGGWWYLSVIGVPYAYIKIRRMRERGFLIHLQYALGLLTFKGYPGAFQHYYSE